VALRVVLTADLLAAITVHAAVGTGLAAVDLLVTMVAVLLVLVGRGPWSLLGPVVALLDAVAAQIAVGYTRMLQGHVPRGVGIVTASALLASRTTDIMRFRVVRIRLLPLAADRPIAGRAVTRTTRPSPGRRAGCPGPASRHGTHLPAPQPAKRHTQVGA
jgi:hypothetical protein